MHVTAPWFVSIRPLQPGSGPRRASPSPCPARFPAPSKPRARAHPPPPPPCLVSSPLRPKPSARFRGSPCFHSAHLPSLRAPRSRSACRAPAVCPRGPARLSGEPSVPPAGPPVLPGPAHLIFRPPLSLSRPRFRFLISPSRFGTPPPIWDPRLRIETLPPNRDPASESGCCLRCETQLRSGPRLRSGITSPGPDSARPAFSQPARRDIGSTITGTM